MPSPVWKGSKARIRQKPNIRYLTNIADGGDCCRNDEMPHHTQNYPHAKQL
jgi:hypothetical protein